MKKFLFCTAVFILALAPFMCIKAQTVSEITNILNTKPQAISSTNVSANNTNLFSLDLTSTAYRAIGVQLTGTWSAAVTFQGSNDNSNFVNVIAYSHGNTSNMAVSATSNGVYIVLTTGFRYIRARTTVYTSGTINSTVYGFLTEINPLLIPNSLVVSGTVGVTSTSLSNIESYTAELATALGNNPIIDIDNELSVWGARVSTYTSADGKYRSLQNLKLTNSTPLITTLVDGNGDQITSFKETQYTEGTSTTSTPTGVAIMWRDNSDNLLGVTNSNPLPIDIRSATGGAIPISGTVSLTAGSTITGNVAHDAVGTGQNPLLIGGYAKAAAPTDVSADGDAVNAWFLRNGSQVMNLAAGGTLITATSTSLNTNITNSSIAVTRSGTWDITNAGTFAVQAASSTSPVSTMNSASANSGLNSAQAAVFDDVSPTSITENSFGFVRMSANRNQYVTLRDAAGNERGLNIDANNAIAVTATNATASNLKMDMSGSAANTTAGLFSVKFDQTTVGTTNAVSIAQIGATTVVNGGTAGSWSVGGMVANNGTINSAVNPILIGGQAVSSENAANTTAKLSQFVTDLVGKLIVLPYANPENFVSGAITTAMTGTTSTSLIAAPASGLRNYITQITVSNSHATVGTDVIIQDGNGGTTLYTIPAAAVYGGAVITFPTPLRQPTTATAIYCADVTTGASVKVSASGYIGK
jgi:hypothetical protein